MIIWMNVNIIGITPLHCAAGEGHSNCVTLLISRGANIEAQDKTGIIINVSSFYFKSVIYYEF